MSVEQINGEDMASQWNAGPLPTLSFSDVREPLHHPQSPPWLMLPLTMTTEASWSGTPLSRMVLTTPLAGMHPLPMMPSVAMWPPWTSSDRSQGTPSPLNHQPRPLDLPGPSLPFLPLLPPGPGPLLSPPLSPSLLLPRLSPSQAQHPLLLPSLGQPQVILSGQARYVGGDFLSF